MPEDEVGSGLSARLVRDGHADVCILAVGKMLEAAEDGGDELAERGRVATVWDVRVVKPLDPAMLADAAAHPLVVTVEDGIRVGGAGSFIADGLRSLGIGRPAGACARPARRVHPPGQARGDPARFGLDAAGIVASVRAALTPEAAATPQAAGEAPSA